VSGARELHPLVRAVLEISAERGERRRTAARAGHERRRAALARSPSARAEWERAMRELDEADAERLADATDWLTALLQLAIAQRESGAPLPSGPELVELRASLLAAASPDVADHFTGLLAIDDALLEQIAADPELLARLAGSQAANPHG
jgi:hypothetical protein